MRELTDNREEMGMGKKIRVFREGRVRVLRDGVSWDAYSSKHPGAVKLGRVPSLKTLEEWNDEGGCEAMCGCWVEPDGHCSIHNKPSWLMAMGYI